MSITLKSPKEIDKMRAAGRVVADVLSKLKERVEPGVSTFDLNEYAIELTKKHDVVPAFLNYPSHSPNTPPFSGVICSSINEQIVHGVPSREAVLKEGDIISIDYGCVKDGYCGDSAITLPVGSVSRDAQMLMEITKESLSRAIDASLVGNRLGDIGYGVQNLVETAGFSVVKEFVGHGIGQKMHEEPQVKNYGTAGKGRVLREGLVLAIEPMVTIGPPESAVLEDGWTIVTKAGGLAAHFEHTVAITKKGPEILTIWD